MNDALPNVPQPTNFIDRVKGKAKEIVGSVVGNDDLVDEGRLHEMKADAEQAAQKEAATAAQTAAEAELISKEREWLPRRQLIAEGAEAAARDRLEREAAMAGADLEREAATRRRRSNVRSAPNKPPSLRMSSRPSSSTKPPNARPSESRAWRSTRGGVPRSSRRPSKTRRQERDRASQHHPPYSGESDAAGSPPSHLRSRGPHRKDQERQLAAGHRVGGFEAEVKQVVGSMLRDGELVEEGRVQQARVTELRRAVELEVQADQKRQPEIASCARSRREPRKSATRRGGSAPTRNRSSATNALQSSGLHGSSPRRPRPSRRPPSDARARDRGRTRREAHAR